jgi:hypothetical protein
MRLPANGDLEHVQLEKIGVQSVGERTSLGFGVAKCVVGRGSIEKTGR